MHATAVFEVLDSIPVSISQRSFNPALRILTLDGVVYQMSENIIFKYKLFLSRNNIPGSRQPNNEKRINELLNETETYAYIAECPAGGCICISEDTSRLGQCLSEMNAIGSSNDFTYKLWDILRG